MAAEIRDSSFSDKTQNTATIKALFSQKQDAKFCDVIMKVCEREIFAHSNVLAAASPYFNTFLSQDIPRQYSQRSPQVIEIQIDGGEPGNLYQDAVESVVNFIYTGDMVLSQRNASQVSEIAKIMQMKIVVDKCEKFLSGLSLDSAEDVSTENCFLVGGEVAAPYITTVDVGTCTDDTCFSLTDKCQSSLAFEESSPYKNGDGQVSSVCNKVKRGRGRPRKNFPVVVPKNVNDLNGQSQTSKADDETSEQDADNTPDYKPPPITVKQELEDHVSSVLRRSSRRFKPTLKGQHLNLGSSPKKTKNITRQFSESTRSCGSKSYSQNRHGHRNSTPGRVDGTPGKVDGVQELLISGDEVGVDHKIKKNKKHGISGYTDKENGCDKKLREANIKQAKHNVVTITPEKYDDDLLFADPETCQDIPEVKEEEFGLVKRNIHREPIAYKCEHCDYNTTNVYRFRRHQLRHGLARFRCKKCTFKTSQIREYQNHQKKHMQEENKCHFCEMQFDDKEGLSEHLQKHKHPKPYYCPVCDMRFKVRPQLQLHMPKHSSDKPFKCRLCRASFKWKHALKNHMVIHTGRKEHLCDICGYATAHKGQLRAHRLMHTGETYHCEVEGCTFQATKKQNIKYHMLTHTREKPHQCDICGQAFSLAKNMRRHLLLHSNERPVRCEHCNFETTRFDKLKEHNFKVHQIGAPPAKKMRVTDMVNNFLGIKCTEQDDRKSIVGEKSELLQMAADRVPDIHHPSDRTVIEILPETSSLSQVLKQEIPEVDNVTQAIIINSSGVIQNVTDAGSAAALLQPPHQVIVETISKPGDGGPVSVGTEQAINLIDQEGTIVAVATSDVVQCTGGATEVIQIPSSNSDGQVQYTELVLPADQVQALVDQVTYVAQQPD